MFESEINVIDKSSVNCTACGASVNHHDPEKVFGHASLAVLICKKCSAFYETGSWSRDEDGQDEYCRWCGEGGRLYICSDESCLKGFCRDCIKRNFGKSECRSIEANDDWVCFYCDPKPIEKLQRVAKTVLQRLSQVEVVEELSRECLDERESKLSSIFGKLQEELKSLRGSSVEDVRQDVLETILNLRVELTELESFVVSDEFAKLVRQVSTEPLPAKQSARPASKRVEVEASDDEQETAGRPSKKNSSDSEFDGLECDDGIEAVESENDSVREVVTTRRKAKRKSAPQSRKSAAKEEINLSSHSVEDEPKESREVLTDINARDCNVAKTSDSKALLAEKGAQESDSIEAGELLKTRQRRGRSPSVWRDVAAPKEKTPEKSETGDIPEEELREENDSEHSGLVEEPADLEDTDLREEEEISKPDSDVKEVRVSLTRLDESTLKRWNATLPSKKNRKVAIEESSGEEDSESDIPILLKEPGRKRLRSAVAGGSDKKSKAKPAVVKSGSDEEDDEESYAEDHEDSDESGGGDLGVKKPFSDSESDRAEMVSEKGSDSEMEVDIRAKASRKPRREVKILSSDEEEVTDESKKPKQRAIPKIPKSGSDSEPPKPASPSESDGETEKSKKKSEKAEKKGKKTRKRARIVDSDDEVAGLSPLDSESGSESDEPLPKSKRKKKGSDDEEKPKTPHRKILSDDKIQKESRVAAKDEAERRKRVLERQKLYNEIEEAMKSDKKDSKVTRCILEYDGTTKEPIVEVDGALAVNMKPHQVEGVKFMYNTVIESVSQLAKKNEAGKTPAGGGAVLAHCMGLGKTFQTICLVHTLLTNEHTKEHIKKVIIVCPCNVVLNWSRELEMWLEENGDVKGRLDVYEFSRVKNVQDRIFMLEQWSEGGGVLIIGYSMFRVMTQAKMKSKKIREKIPKLLHDPGADLVVCDEGHMLKSDKAQISKAMNLIKTRRRIILTGTPLQNNMSEYHCMVSFVKPNLLGTNKEFNNRFMNPITYGQEANASQYSVKIMKKRVHILNKLLGGCVHRCDYSHLTPYLPQKFEYILSIQLSDLQNTLYRKYLEHIGITEATTREDLRGRSLLKDYQVLKMIWSHPYLLMESADRQEDRRAMAAYKNELDEFVNDGSEEEEEPDFDSEKSASSEEEDDESKPKRNYRTRGNRKDNPDSAPEEEEEVKTSKYQNSWWKALVPDDEEEFINLNLSSKLLLALEILRDCELIGDKVILFSTSLLTLSLFERLLQFEYERSSMEERVEGDYINSWVHGIDYFRLDGSTSVDTRKKYIDSFNDMANLRSRLFLVSTKAGGIGTNMVGANRIIVLDASWNPSDDTQAIFRAFRYGQLKPVYVYRLLAHATMEEKIYDRQVNKISLASRVVDEQNLERHFNESDLKALYEYKPEKDARKTPAVPKDRLLAELLIKHKSLIQGYHEHDSLLQKELEDELTEEERKTAWKEYEDERDGKTVPGAMGPQMGPNPYNMPNMGAFPHGAFPQANMSQNGNFPHANINRQAAFASAQQQNFMTMMYMQNLRKLFGQQQDNLRQNSPKNVQDLLKRPPHFNFECSHPTLNPQAMLDEVKIKNPNADQMEIAVLYRQALINRRENYFVAIQRARQSIDMYTRHGLQPPKPCLDVLQDFESAGRMLLQLIPKLDEAISGAKDVLRTRPKPKQPIPVIDLDATLDERDANQQDPSTSQRAGTSGGPIIEEIE